MATSPRVKKPRHFHDLCPLCGGAKFASMEEENVATWLNYTCSQCGLTCEVQIGPETPILAERLAEWSSLFPDD